MRTEWTICITVYNDQDEAIATTTFTAWTDGQIEAAQIGAREAATFAKSVAGADYWDVDLT